MCPSPGRKQIRKRPKDFWQGKTPCWDMRGCIAQARDACAAYHDRSRPCWEQETLCRQLCGMDACFVCDVFKRYVGKPEK